MIRRLKIKFIALSLTALFVLLSAIVAGMNFLNYRAIVSEADATLALLSENKGTFPILNEGGSNWLPPDMSPEIPFESRFFSVLVRGDDKIVHMDISRIYAIDNSEVVRYVLKVLTLEKDCGFLDNYRFSVFEEDSGVRITFLDCGRKLDIHYSFVFFSIFMSLCGYFITAVVICFFAERFVRPVAESYERQRRFITDAGHEIKTPLTIISANADVLKMDMGENECLSDISQQTTRLSRLTDDLIYLARMEEGRSAVRMAEFSVSEVISDTAASFQVFSRTQGIEFSYSVEPMLRMYGVEGEISKLVSILLDNAFKYSAKNGPVSLVFEKSGRRLNLTVKNVSETPLESENLRHVFDRFYRMDSSRSSETGGYGIGLSIAKAIVSEHGGKINAVSPDGRTFSVTVSF